MAVVLFFVNVASAQSTLTKLHEFTGLESTSQNAFMIEGLDGRLYGWIGHASQDRQSLLWRIDRDGSNFVVLHTFTSLVEDGEDPTGLVFSSGGRLFGTARDQSGNGRVFELSANGNGDDYHVLKEFSLATDMTRDPFGLIEAGDGRLYGITGTGGSGGGVYGIDKDGGGFLLLHRFGSTSTDGQFPRGLLLDGPDGNLYGVTASDRPTFLGTVYRIGRGGSGYEIIHRFTGDGQGSLPDSGLILGTDGFLYGQCAGGGTGNVGGVFRLRPDGSEYAFFETGYGGAQWYRGVTESADGFLYGAHPGGGSEFSGTLFRIRRDGTGFETLQTFVEATEPPTGVRPKQILHGSDGFLYCLTHQRSAIPIASLTAFTPFLLRYGPVPLPTTQSPAPLRLLPSFVRREQGADFILSFTGEPNHEYDIQFTDSLPTGWQSAQNITADAQGKVEFIDTTAGTRPARFFRVGSN